MILHLLVFHTFLSFLCDSPQNMKHQNKTTLDTNRKLHITIFVFKKWNILIITQ
jgi:hypothetical protein